MDNKNNDQQRETDFQKKMAILNQDLNHYKDTGNVRVQEAEGLVSNPNADKKNRNANST